MIKILIKMEIKGMVLNIVKIICHKSMANIILKGEQLKSFSLISGIRQGCPVTPLLLNIIVEVLVIATRQNKDKKIKVALIIEIFLYMDLYGEYYAE